MATSSDLMGLSIPPGAAGLLGLNPSAVTCAGTTSGTATAITTALSNLTAASSETGAILPASMPLGTPYVVNTTSSTSAVVYPPSGATINGASSLTVAQNKTAVFYRYSATLIFSVLTA